MAGIDPSIPLNANRPQPVNPLTQMQQYAQTGNAQLQMAQARMQLMSRNALMQAYQNAPLDPATGLPDTRAVLNYLQQNNGGLAMPDAVKDAQIQGLQGYATRQADLSQSLNRNSAIAQFMAPVLALGDNATPGDVHDAISRAYNAGVPTDGVMSSLQTQLPITDPDQFGNPAYRKQLGRDTHAFAQSLVLQGQAPNVGLDAATPKPTFLNTGPTTVAPDMSGITNHGATSLSVPMGTSPSFDNDIIQIGQTQDGAPVMGTRKQAIAKAGGGLAGAFQPPAGPAPGGAPAPAAPAASPATLPGGGYVGGLGVGEKASLAGDAEASVAQYNQLHGTVNGYGGRMFQLTQALQGLQNSPTGPGTDTTNNIKSFILAQDPGVLRTLGISPDAVTIANHDMANKYLTQYATGAATAFGHGTDQQLSATLTGNASTHISNLAAQDVVKSAMALERMKAAQVQAFDQSGLPSAQFNKWAVGWQKNIDPRVFEFDLLTPEQRTALVGSLGKPGSAAYESFAKKLYAAQQSQFLTPPEAPNGTP